MAQPYKQGAARAILDESVDRNVVTVRSTLNAFSNAFS
jgi:hypothetical protein